MKLKKGEERNERGKQSSPSQLPMRLIPLHIFDL